jgi:MFS transporter, PAT family, beta-lactamase induction signal transducer AmpG
MSARQAVVFFLGFSSGLPLLLTYSTLQSWYTVAGVDIVTIGFLGLVGLPYTFKFLWAPCLDRFIPSILGRRRGWIFITQCLLIIGIVVMACLDPAATPLRLAVLALGVAFCSATQDVGADAYRTEILLEKERALGVAFFMVAYRIAMIVSGGVALILADNMGWRNTYFLMALLMIVGVLVTLLSSEPEQPSHVPKTFKEAIVLPWREFLTRDNAGSILLFILLYKLGDAFVMSLAPTFLLGALAFSLSEVGTVTKIIGLAMTILGVFIASGLVHRMGLLRALFLFGICQGCSNLILMVLAMVGKHYSLMVLAVSVENLCAGMEGAAIVIFLTGLCNTNYTAAQYALLSAIAAIGRVLIGPAAGYVQLWLGWVNFFFVGFLVTIPPLLILLKLRSSFNGYAETECKTSHAV